MTTLAHELPADAPTEDEDLPHVIALWHAGKELSIKQLEALHRAMSETTVEQMIRSYEFVGRVA